MIEIFLENIVNLGNFLQVKNFRYVQEIEKDLQTQEGLKENERSE